MINDQKLVLKSPAKINLGLKIIKKRDDGYHEIETIFQMVSLFDTLTFRSIQVGIVLKTDRDKLPVGETNLVVKAAKLLQQETGIQKGVEIFLEKKIPVGAGLGGGSGNAAFTLMGLNNLWELHLKKKDLMKLAITLGSDVPFFLSDCSAAIGKGRGEILTPFENRSNIHVVIVSPNIHISTGSIYKEMNLGLTSNSKDINILRSLLVKGRITELGSYLYNDLETVVCKRYPALTEIKKKLINSGAVGALVSGSGSSVFGIYLQQETARKATTKLISKEWQVFLTETIN
ncbi:MAG TPA: 4-(cytidine 5'-diphospho)-2-C-methyl-D-erythritol kinase [Nitrospinota bacterium]|nr:4-(cytidine 5'-diphospho)-2-C-methyl-D-erythritol kinase [Nitrospinota bacterium]